MKIEYNELIDFIKRYYSDISLKNAEMYYLLSNFFLLFDRTIPIEMEYCFITLEKYQDLVEIESSFEEKEKKHPIILQLDNKSFIINYFSQKLCDYLGYKKDELLGHDMHTILPTQLRAAHSSRMRNFILNKNKSNLRKDTFLLTSEGYCFPVRINFSVLPALEDIKIIVDVNQVRNSNKQFFFILSQDLNLIAFNREFEANFGLTAEMFDKMHISILNLFGIYHNQILQDFKTSIEEIENYTKGFDKSHDNSERSYHSGEKIDKNMIFNNKTISVNYLTKLQSFIQDNALGKDWMTIIRNLEDDFYRRKTANRLLNVKNKKKSDDSGDSYRIHIELRSLKDVPFFFMTIQDSEKINYNNVVYFRHTTTPSSKDLKLNELKDINKENRESRENKENRGKAITTKIETADAFPLMANLNESVKETSTMNLLINRPFHQIDKKIIKYYTNSSQMTYADTASIFDFQEEEEKMTTLTDFVELRLTLQKVSTLEEEYVKLERKISSELEEIEENRETISTFMKKQEEKIKTTTKTNRLMELQTELAKCNKITYNFERA